MNINEIKDEIIKYSKILYDKNLSPATSGNISARCGDNILISASGTCLGMLTYDDIVLVNIEGHCLEKDKKASSEKFLHIETYKLRPDVNCVIHLHSPKATAIATSGKDLTLPISAELVYYFGKIELAKYATPSSNELVKNTVPHLSTSNGVLLQNHGVLVCGQSIREAFFNAERIEAYSQIYLDTQILNTTTMLTPDDINAIEQLKSLK